MSTSIYKVEYKCDCGINYGDCDAKCAIVLRLQNSVDVYTIYHTDSHRYLGNGDKPKTTIGGLKYFSSCYFKALNTLLNMKDSNANKLTEDERDTIFN